MEYDLQILMHFFDTLIPHYFLVILTNFDNIQYTECGCTLCTIFDMVKMFSMNE